MDSFDLLIVGGGINGAAIARDAAHRGQKVLLVEKDDLAAHTSSASSKLIHGGLRYLEYYEFRLVREALQEREMLLRSAPHIVRPLQFVLPHGAGMRPWWMVRAGLKLYDLLASGGSLPRSRSLRRREAAFAEPLKEPARKRVALYWDAWVDDARLVVLNAVDAAEHGAEIATRTALVSAYREGELWHAKLSNGREVAAKTIVNAAGPWVADVLQAALRQNSASKVRLIKGSHIVVTRLFEGEQAYILQQPDGRVVFALPYGVFTLIGTTDVPVATPEEAVIGEDEVRYLCEAANRYFLKQISPADLVWSYSGVRSLHDDGAESAQAVTRDYHLEFDAEVRLLSVFGGKITTARALAEEAMHLLGHSDRSPTRTVRLPGAASEEYRMPAWLPADFNARLSGSYGSRAPRIIEGAAALADLGRDFGAGLYEAEIDYLRAHEFARTAGDILWRRTKLGLHMTVEQRQAVADYLGEF